MDDTNDQTPEVEVEEVETPESDITDWEAEAKKARGIAARLRTKLVKATEVKKPAEQKEAKGLDNADYALLMASGIKEDDEVELVEKYMKKWDLPLRQVLKDSDIQEKLKGMRLERDVKNAMPSATKRGSSGQIDNLDYWTAKYEQTGELPENFELASAVVNAKIQKASPNTPPWRRK